MRDVELQTANSSKYKFIKMTAAALNEEQEKQTTENNFFLCVNWTLKDENEVEKN